MNCRKGENGMKKHKRLLSFLLAAIMLLSVPTAAFTAFAADDGNAVADMEAFLKDATEWTDEMGTKWKALTEEQKDSVNHFYSAKIHTFAWNKVGGGMTKDRETKAGELLGGYTPKTRQAMDFAQRSAGNGTCVVSVGGTEYTIDLKKGGWGSNRWDYVNNFVYKNGDQEITVTPAQQKAVYDQLRGEFDALTTGQQALMDYMNGSSDKYVNFGNVARLNTTQKFMLQFLPLSKIALGEGYTPEQFEKYFLDNFGFSQAADWDVLGGIRFILNMRDKAYNPYKAYTEPTDAQDDAYLAAYEGYKAMIDDSSSMASIAKNTYAQFAEVDGKSTGLGTLNSNINKVYSDIIGKRQGDAFNEKVSKIQIPAKGSEEFNTTLIALQKEYTALTPLAKKRVIPHYYELVGKYINNTGIGQKESTHVVPEQVTVETQAPELVNNILQNALAPTVNLVVGGLLGSLNGLFTNDLMNATFLGSISTELGKQMSQLAFTPDSLAAMIGANETQFAKAKQELTGKTDWADVGALDWGVIPGDYETFSKALCVSLRGVLENNLLSFAGLLKAFGDTFTLTKEGVIDPKKGYTFGLYGSVLVPVLEMCGVDNFISSYEYTQRANGHKTITNHNDMYLKLMLDELYYKLLPKVAANPTEFLLNSLPNLVYHMEDGCFFRDVEASLRNTMGLLADPLVNLVSPYLGLEKIWNLLTQPGTDANGNATAPMLDLAALGIDLTYEDIAFIAKLGKGEVTETECKKYDSTVTITSDTQSVKNYLVNLIYGITGDLGIEFNPQRTFVKTEAPQYPHNGKMDKKVMNAMVDGFDTLLGGVVNLKDTVNNGVFTNEMAANAITGIYGLLGASVTPKQVAAMMTEDRYADLRLDLDFDTWADVALVVKNEKSVIYQADMGFKNGDRQGFLDCVVASLRPLCASVGALLTNTQAADGSTQYGLYETLVIPVLEAIGLAPAADSVTYTDNYQKLMKKTDPNKAYDYLVNTILTPVLGLLDSFVAAPLDTLTKVLPNLAYAIQYNPDVAIVGNLLAGEDGTVNLAGLLQPLLESLLPGFELPALNLDALASCGNVVEKDSKSVIRDTFTVVEADRADAFVTIYYYLYDAINYKDNMKLLKEKLAGIEDMDPALQNIVNSVINDVFTAGKEESLCKLGSLLAADAWECPDTAGTSGSKTPSTGDTGLSALVIMGFMLTAGAAILVLRRKKETQA